MHAVLRRGGAVLVDLCLSNVIGALLALPLFLIAENPIPALILTTPFLNCATMFCLTLAFYGNTPGKLLFQLEVVGDGCIICREIQRLGWYLLLGAQPILALVLPLPIWVMALISVAWIAIAFVRPMVSGQADFPHNTTTGFEVIDIDEN